MGQVTKVTDSTTPKEDLWGVYEPRKKPQDNPASIKRAMKRKVYVTSESHKWVVDGDEKLGDTRDTYTVRLPANTTKYDCDCYHTKHGDARARRMCSHVHAVILCRKGTKDFENADETDFSKVGEVTEESQSQPPLDTDPDIHQAGSSESILGRLTEEPPSLRDDGNNEGKGVGQVSPFSAPTPTLASTLNKLNELNEPPALHDTIFGRRPLPEKFTQFRPNQWAAIEEIVNHFDDGKKVVFLDAPTGTGKTLIGEMVGRLMVGDKTGQRVYACTTKSLQEQIVSDFGYANQIKGRANYKPVYGTGVTCDDCTGNWEQGPESCDYCPNMNECPYRIAKTEASNSYLPILNVAYFLNETRGLQSQFVNRPFVVIDESDTTEDQLLSYYEVVFSTKFRQKAGITTVPKKTVQADWVRWLRDEALPTINDEIIRLTSQRSLFGERSVEEKRWVKQLSSQKSAITPILKDEGEGWVLTGYDTRKPLDSQTIVFKPIRVNEFARRTLWSKGHQFLFMSASTISAAQEAEDLGLEDHEWASVEVDSEFPPTSRPILYDPVVAMGYKTKNTDYPVMTKAIRRIIDGNPGCRILVHTVSYALAQHLVTNLNNSRVMTYRHSGERDWALKQFLNSADGVMLAPSFERGIDLPGEDCEIIIIPKVPYPSMGDKQVNARMHSKGGDTWYAKKTIRSIVQMTGRGMRSADDWCDTYILDAQFGRLYAKHKRMFPSWWKKALAVTTTKPSHRELRQAAEARREGRQAVK